MLFIRPSGLHGASASVLFVLCACSGTDVGYPRVSDTPSCPDLGSDIPVAGSNAAPNGGGANERPGGQAGGGAPSGSAGSGSAGGHVDVGQAGNTGSSAAAGAAATTPFSWPGAYDPTASPTPADGHHNAGAGCMSSTCHGSKVPFLFGGTVYAADGVTGAPNVQVAISDGALTVTAYSASNGNLWLPISAGAIDFSVAQIAIRDAQGERVKPATAGRGAACNGGGCHGAAMRLLAP